MAVRSGGARALILSAVLVACGSSGGGGSTGPDTPGLDPNVAPVTQGNWYRPAAAVTWQWQLQGAVNTGYVVDLYDVDLFETPDPVFTTLHNAGIKVVCYFSAGSGEDWRPDYGSIPAAALGKTLQGYANERWLDIRLQAVLDVMVGRLDLAVNRGCDGVEPDNVDGYINDTGFPLSASNQLGFNRQLANAAHQRGLGVALKNSGDQAADLVDYFDLELNEECHLYNECNQLMPFLNSGKPVLNVEYTTTAQQAAQLATTVCPAATALGLRTLIMPPDLDDSFRYSCF